MLISYIFKIHLSNLRNHHWKISISKFPDFIWISHFPKKPISCSASTLDVVVMSSGLWQFLRFFCFFFFNDNFWRVLVQVFHRMSLNLDLSDVLPMIRLELKLWGRRYLLLIFCFIFLSLDFLYKIFSLYIDTYLSLYIEIYILSIYVISLYI